MKRIDERTDETIKACGYGTQIAGPCSIERTQRFAWSAVGRLAARLLGGQGDAVGISETVNLAGGNSKAIASAKIGQKLLHCATTCAATRDNSRAEAATKTRLASGR